MKSNALLIFFPLLDTLSEDPVFGESEKHAFIGLLIQSWE